MQNHLGTAEQLLAAIERYRLRDHIMGKIADRHISMTSNRLLGADFMRAAACLMVLLHHLAFRMNGNFVPAAVAPVMDFLVMGSFGVAIFFVLSGFLLARPFWVALDKGEAMPSIGLYALRRAARILPGFWLVLTVSFVLSYTMGNSVLDGELVQRFVAGALLVSDWHWLSLFPVDNNGPLWSIGFEVTSYLLLPACLFGLFFVRGAVADWMMRFIWVGIIGLVLLAHAAVVAWAPIDEVERGWQFGLIGGAKGWMPNFNPIGFFAIFAIGALAAGVQVMLAQQRSALFDAIGLLAILAGGWIMADHIGGLNEGYGWLGIPYAFPWMPLVVGVALVALPSSVMAGRLLDNGVARFLGKISFGIYVWHFLVIEMIATLAPPAFQTNGENGWTIWLASSAAAIVVSIILATLSFYLLEQPMIRYARTLEGRRDKPAAAAVQLS